MFGWLQAKLKKKPKPVNAKVLDVVRFAEFTSVRFEETDGKRRKGTVRLKPEIDVRVGQEIEINVRPEQG